MGSSGPRRHQLSFEAATVESISPSQDVSSHSKPIDNNRKGDAEATPSRMKGEPGNHRDDSEEHIQPGDSLIRRRHPGRGRCTPENDQRSRMEDAIAAIGHDYLRGSYAANELPSMRREFRKAVPSSYTAVQQRFDLQGCKDLGISDQALEYLQSNRGDLGIPKAIRQELERVQALAHREQPPPEPLLSG